jgi:prepilin-type processing-associated H-X9-DG protein
MLEPKRQLTIAWTLYADDSNGRLAPNPLDNFAFSWGFAETGMLPWTGDVQHWDVWTQSEIEFLIFPARACLGSYAQNREIYTCPEDRFVSPVQKAAGLPRRIRNVSMNLAMGYKEYGFPQSLGLRTYMRLSDIAASSPANRFVFIDEHPDTIEYGYFFVPVGRSHDEALADGFFHNLPGSLHNGGATLSFADSHVESKRWRLPETRAPVQYSTGAIHPTREKDDYLWLAARTGEPY